MHQKQPPAKVAFAVAGFGTWASAVPAAATRRRIANMRFTFVAPVRVRCRVSRRIAFILTIRQKVHSARFQRAGRLMRRKSQCSAAAATTTAAVCATQKPIMPDGVIATISGYIGGTKQNPTYQEVSAGITGHAEAVQVEYDPTKVSYEKLLDVYWHNVDPTQKNGQFCDHGNQYRTAIFFNDEAQKKAAEGSKAALVKSKPFKGDIVTEIVPATTFYPAEDYHQDYYLKNPVRYKFYRTGCGRDARLKELWGAAAPH
jgi:peptide-methionine (S)-S-oxide reductase